MLTWTASPTSTFLNELLNLPKNVSKQVPRKIEILEKNPVSANGDAKKLKDYENVYRVRIGDYRLFYTFGQGWVKLLSIRKRDERTYELEQPEFTTPELSPDVAALAPQATPAATAFASVTTISDQSTPAATSTSIATALPYELTESLLQQWQIPQQYWQELLSVQNSEALLELPLPDKFISRILDNLYPRSLEEIKVQPEYLLQNPDDLERFVEGNLSDFLLKLDPEQEKLLNFEGRGPILVKGGPGTGKSTLALYWVQKLRDQGHQPILFTTYTKALVNYSEQLLQQLLGQPPKAAGVEVNTVDSLAYRYYTNAYGQTGFAKDDQCLTCLEETLRTAEIPASNIVDRKVRQQTLQRLGTSYLLQEIQTVIESWGVSTLDEYLAIDRRGREIPLKANIREAIWSIYQTWQTLMAKYRYITWEQLRRKALEIATQLPEKPYQAVIIDEAQDLSPVALRFLLALVASPQSVYLTADASQSLYQRGFRWKQVHSDLKVAGRTLMLRRNYRNTQQIAAACTTILQSTDAGDTECLVQELSPHQGELPIVLLADEYEQEIQAIREFFTTAAGQFRLPLHSGAVLCPNQQTGQAIAKHLTGLGMKAKFVSGKAIDINQPYIKILTLHSAKGLEFPFVVVVGLRKNRLPYIDSTLPADEIPAVLNEQLRLFYVGCSRAMRALMVCGSQSDPSPFLDSLSIPHWQRQAIR